LANCWLLLLLLSRRLPLHQTAFCVFNNAGGEKRRAGRNKISWQMTNGNFWKLFLIVLMNTGSQLLALPTIIGAIPVTGFVNTARAAAFRMIWEEGSYAET